MQKPKVIAVVGPTASGKTSLSIKIAKKFKGEVISADSRQVYKGMDLGTGKVTKEEMEGVLHHLLDIVEPTAVYTGADFNRDATSALDEIVNRGNCPIIAGGTFFYLDLLRGKIQSAPVAPNEDFRNSLAPFTNEELYAQLQEKDSERAADIDRFNRHRLIRALEITEALGVVPKSQISETPYEWLVLGITVEPKELKQNIRTRLIERLDQGMVAEVEKLHDDGVSWERLDDFGLEYRYVAKYLQKDISYDDMVSELVTKIGQYAKRQRTWLKKDSEIVWFESSNQAAIFERIEKFLAA